MPSKANELLAPQLSKRIRFLTHSSPAFDKMTKIERHEEISEYRLGALSHFDL
jgi:hypothetical protein